MNLIKLLFAAVLLLACASIIDAQEECIGSLGSNLFDRGDFGTGTTNNIITNPNIAPGYGYVTLGPPSDGDYILTNNMGSWSNLYGTWLPLRDNSSDINGYMMVVNASFEPGLFYEEVIEDICENTQFEFSADIINVIKRNVSDHIRPNVAFLIDDEVVLQTGDIPQDERWHTYAFSFTTQPGQSSVKLSLRNNAPGGIGNDLALDNIRFRACGPPSTIVTNLTDSIGCLEDLPLQLNAQIQATQELADPYYQWEVQQEEDWIELMGANDAIYNLDPSDPGTYSYRLSFAGTQANLENDKCRFFSEPITIYVPQRNFDRTDTICGGTGIDISGLTINQPGIYLEELISSVGCDSITTYFVDTIARATISAQLSITDPLCFGDANGIVSGSEISNGYPPYFISIDGSDYATLRADNVTSGAKNVQIKDRYGCFFEESINLNDPDEFIVSMGADKEIVLGEELFIDILSNQTIAKTQIIENLDGLADTSSLVFLPFNDSRLIIRAISEGECTALDTLAVTVDQDVRIFIPNVFSPNQDGLNDNFKISALGKSLDRIDEFNIFSRWGESIEFSSDPNGWNGKDKDGKPYTPGVYLYQLKATLINGAVIEKKGTLQLIK